MNSYLRDNWSWIEGTTGMRDGFLERLTDEDLGFTPGGEAPTLGELIAEHERVQRSYVAALGTFHQEWERDGTAPADLAALRARFAELDGDLHAAVAALSDQDLDRPVTRGSDGFQLPVRMLLDVYVQACLIFFGKATVYVKAMSRPLPPSVAEYIW